MSSQEDNAYDFQGDTPDPFEITKTATPEEAVDVNEGQEGEPKAQGQEQEEKTNEHQENEDEGNLYSDENSDKTSSETAISEEPKEEVEAQAQAQAQAEAEAEAETEAEGDEDEYDPTAEAEKASENGNENENDEDTYDPTADFTEDTNDTKVTSQTITSATSTPQVTSSSTASIPSGIDPKIANQLTQILFSDPEFLKLSYDQQQKKVLEEFTRLSQANISSTTTPVENTHRPNFEVPMSLEERNEYNAYLDNEAKYNSRYPYKANSRLFVGNLPANFSKENLFRMFRAYGKILQISIKNSYAFIQFDDAPSVVRAIEKEFGIPLYGKDLVLEIAKNSRPETLQNPGGPGGPLQGSTADSGLHGNKFFESRKRAREEYLKGNYTATSNPLPLSGHQGPDNRHSSKRRHHQLECQILVKQSADPNFAKETAKFLSNAGINTEYEFLKHGQSLDKRMNDAAYSGIMGVVLVNRNRTLDLFHYEKNADGGIKYDEYNSISYYEVATILKNAKSRRDTGSQSPYQSHANPYSRNQNPYGNQSPPPPPQQDPNVALLQSLQSVNPQQLQALLALAGNLQQPQQLPYGQPQFNQFAQQPNLGNVDLASLISKLQPQGFPQQNAPLPPQSQPFNSYNPIQQSAGPSYNQGSSYQPQQQQQQQPQQPQHGANNVQSLLDTLSKFQK